MALLQHAFFTALECSGAIGKGTRIAPRYILLRDQEGLLVACAPAMLSTGTLTEYGPEYLWLDSGLKAGCFSWPKFQVGLPLYPVRCQKLMVRSDVRPDSMRKAVIQSLLQLVKQDKLATFNLMHVDRDTALKLRQEGWLISHEVHSFWNNTGYGDFETYLKSLPHRKRYMMNKDRRKVAQLGLTIKLIAGESISPTLLDSYYAGHRKVCLRHGNHPWLPIEVLQKFVELMPDSVRLIAAFDGDRYVAGAFWILDSSALYLRTWSAMEELPELCFELVCYRPIIHAIENGLKYIDSGLYGGHKQQRGYPDELVYSAHWFRDDKLRQLAIRELSKQG